MRWSTYKKALIHKVGTEKRTTDHGIDYNVFTNIPKMAEITKDRLYKRVWVVDLPRTTKVKAIGLTDVGVELKFQGEIPIRTYFHDEVMLHPSEWEDDRKTEKK